MLIKVTTAVILLSLFIHYVEGFERVIIINDFISDGGIRSTKDFGSGSIECCYFGNCSCSSLHNALANLTSNVVISISIDVVLFSIMPLVDLANITITGYNNPTVNCNNSGGLYFVSCHNCTMEGITWNECGYRNISDGNVSPVLHLFSSSYITIKNCSFQHSIGQAVVLSEMMGDVNIHHCNFFYNKQYKGHGTSLYYNSSYNYPVNIAITNCTFSYNEGAKSVAYFGPSSIGTLCLQNLKLYHNKGVPIYLSNQNLHISGNIKFYNNTAENGGGIFISDYSNVTFHKQATVTFTHNTANSNGGAIFLADHSSIAFKEHHACHNGKTLQMESIAVMFQNNKAQYGGAIYSNNSNIIFGECAVVEIADGSAEEKGGAVYGIFSAIMFDGNSAVSFVSNVANEGGGALVMNDYANITFKGNSAVELKNNNGGYAGGAMIFSSNDINCIVTFEENTTVTFITNSAVGGGALITEHARFTFRGNSTMIFINNSAHYDDGGAWIIDRCSIKFQDNSRVIFNGNRANNDGGAIMVTNSTVTFEDNSAAIFNVNNADYRGGAVFIDGYSNITFAKKSVATFFNNSAVDGGAMAILGHSSINFQDNSTVNANANNAFNGGGACVEDNAMVIFNGNSNVLFSNNKAVPYNGGALAVYESSITFEENSTITFTGNSAHKFGGALRVRNSVIRFGGNSKVALNANTADQDGGACYIEDHSSIKFVGNSLITYFSNRAIKGGAVAIYDHSYITFNEDSTVKFYENSAQGYGGAMRIINNCSVNFEKDTAVTFNANKADYGGACCIGNHSRITISGNSLVKYFNNSGDEGGAMAIHDYSIITFKGNSIVKINNSAVNRNGGAIIIINNCIVTFEESSSVTFSINKATFEGGALCIKSFSNIIFGENSTVKFFNNTAFSGGAVVGSEYSNVMFKGNATVSLKSNSAYDRGGAVTIKDNGIVIFEGNSQVTFNVNKAGHNGGACYIEYYSNITLTGNPTVAFNHNSADIGGAVMLKDTCVAIFEEACIMTFNNNTADSGGALMVSETSTVSFKGNSEAHFNANVAHHIGGAVCVSYYSTVTFAGNSTNEFHNNQADYDGGVVYLNQYSVFKSKEHAKVTFNNNTAVLGGSIFITSSNASIEENSSANFSYNTARQNGGAIYLNDNSNLMLFNTTNVSFYFNNAGDYGGAVYALLKDSSINFFGSDVQLIDNTAGTVQTPVYIKLPKSCDDQCPVHRVNGNINKTAIATSPTTLMLYNPAKYITSGDTNCNSYFINNIMLGQEITFDACLLDYYDQPTEAAQFLITGMDHQDYNISGSQYITISCNSTIQGISVTGNLHSNNSYNYTIDISLYVVHTSDSKIVSARLTVELSQCHPGFWYFSKSRKCECYDFRNVISCSGSRSTIKRGYWYGIVNGNPTVSMCPNDYCNFTCCEVANGVYHLSPVRENQCRPHRSGTTCGSCDRGYALSFDSPECVELNKCTIGTVLVTTLSLLYWISVMVTVFAMMYFKVTIGSLYAIVYYYSVVDILLSRVLFISNALHTTVTIMSSFAKLTPQFLGKLCLVKNMSGIDQQFIHYVHPLVILSILIMISVLARRSRMISSFISRGVIHFICFLLLLSYTSMATTSLLLMRPLRFVDIDKVYTYLSPDIEYFHGRHLAYVTVAIIFAMVIVIGFPLLLLLEPFLNSKINFIKIKPLLDQFQGCYKDKYRYFAGYYMICRLVIILLVIVKISDDFTSRYLLISSCALMQLIHVLVRPYVSVIHNIFDGIILQLIVIISVLPIVEFVDSYDETFVLVVIYLFVILPLISFIGVKLLINRKSIQYTIKYLRTKCYCKYNLLPTDDPDELIEENEFSIVVDDSIRRHTMIVNVNEQSDGRLPDIMWCRDPFMEQLNEIEALNDIRY